MKKYTLIKDKVTGLYRVKYLIDIPKYGISTGDVGGLIKSYYNLSQLGMACVTGQAQVTDNARVTGDALVTDDAWVTGNAKVTGNAWVTDDALVTDDARITGNALIAGNAQITDSACVTGNAKVTGDAMWGMEWTKGAPTKEGLYWERIWNEDKGEYSYRVITVYIEIDTAGAQMPGVVGFYTFGFIGEYFPLYPPN